MAEIRRTLGGGQGDSSSYPVSVEVSYGEVDYDISGFHASAAWRDAPPSRNTDPSTCWIAADRSIAIAGYSIEGGLIYVGDDLAPASAHRTWVGTEPALINPTLPIGPDAPADEQHWVSSYWDASPKQRTRYLEWLSRGRTGEADSLCLTLFLFGIERRLLHDLGGAPPRDELGPLEKELERLADEYADHARFAYSASQLLDLVSARRFTAGATDEVRSIGVRSWQVPLELRIGMGREAKARVPLSAEMAVAWLMMHPEAYLRTPATRCPDEFAHLTSVRYAERLPHGLELPAEGRPITLSYRPENPGIERSTEVNIPLPDVASDQSVSETLRELGRSVCSELDSFSRRLGKLGDTSPQLTDLALLPRELLLEVQSEQLEEVRAWLNVKLSNGDPAAATGRQLLNAFRASTEEKLSKKDSVAVAQLLQKLGFGFEPDPRFGGGGLKAETAIVLFHVDARDPSTPSVEYANATAMLHLVAAVATSDGEATPAELRHLESVLASSPGLDWGERVRLGAHLEWLLTSMPSLAGLKKRISELDSDQRLVIADSAIAMAASDGSVGPAEMKTLTKVFALLGLDPDELPSHIHHLAAREHASRAVSGGPNPSGDGFTLDRSTIDERLKESAAVASLLGTVFAEDPAHELPPAQATSREPGLPLRRLIAMMEANPVCNRVALETMADENGILLDAALEELNERAFAICGEPLFEGDDPLEIDVAVLKAVADE